MRKKVLRAAVKNQRKAVSEKQLKAASKAISDRLLDLPIWQLSYFHIFMSISNQKEIDTSSIISLLQNRQKRIVIPKVVGSGLQHYLWNPTLQLQPNKWNILEPAQGSIISERQIDVVFVPLLAFDQFGNRVGYGKGFYDTFLARCRQEVIKVGLSLFSAEDSEIEDVSEHDIPLDFCVTPNTIYNFR